MLSPLGWLYGLGTKIRLSNATPKQCGRPVICVGNIVAGGSGKTPVVMDLAKRLNGAHVVSRGYGGTIKNTTRVSYTNHTATQVGDEPLMMAETLPTWIANSRIAGCAAAITDGADVIIFDDGFQDPAIKKDLSLIIVDGGFGFGNGHMIPAGPLRESISNGLSRTDAVIVIGSDTTNIESLVAGRCPILRAALIPKTAQKIGVDRIGKVMAFAGIGRPEKFFDSVREIGCEIVDSISFADHHPYTNAEIETLISKAKSQGAQPLTTKKDWVRIPKQLRSQIAVLTVDLKWEDDSQLENLLKKHISTV